MNTPISRDAFGPEYVLDVYDPALGMRGFLVVDNTALGPGKGGIRMSATVSAEEVYRLARTMTWKNALAGIPFGGAKAGIVWPPSAASAEGGSALKKKFIQSFARAIAPYMPARYIAGPDVNTGEREMRWFVEATGNWRTATGKPADYCMRRAGGKGKMCGIPHEFGSTGFGVVQATRVAAAHAGIPLKGATVAIHGFGNVGTFVYKYLTELGARVVALADASGAVYAKNGLDSHAVHRAVKGKKLLAEAFKKEKISLDAFWSAPADILIPASVTDVIHDGNKKKIQAKLIVEGGNIPMREDIERELWRRGIIIVPDFVANAGGVISSYAEYRGYSPEQMFQLVKRKIVVATEEVISVSMEKKAFPRDVALALATSRVIAAQARRVRMR